SLDVLESSLARRALPADKVRRRWAETSPPGGLVLAAPEELLTGRLVPGAERGALLDGFAELATVLRASAVLFATPADLSPSTASRDALRRFFAEDAHAGRFPGMARVWRPSGLWELAATARFAPELDL